jgi:hypothetical protein
MDSPSTFKMPQVETHTHPTEVADVVREECANSELMGAVVVGHTACADSFRWRGELQAGRKEDSLFPSMPVKTEKW